MEAATGQKDRLSLLSLLKDSAEGVSSKKCLSIFFAWLGANGLKVITTWISNVTVQGPQVRYRLSG